MAKFQWAMICGLMGALIAAIADYRIDDWQYWVFIVPLCLIAGFSIGLIERKLGE